MIWETSLLHYPDYRGNSKPYDECIMDDDRDKIGFYFDIYLSDGTYVKFPNTGVELNITVPPNTQLYIERFSFNCSKDFKPGELRFQPYFQRRSEISNHSYDKEFINNNYPIEKEYLNDLIFTKETNYTLLIQGELVDPKKTKRKGAKEETVYNLITQDDPQLVVSTGSRSMNYVFGIRITNHWDVKFNGAYHNKLYMLNDDCDGFIWEKKHTPNDYIIHWGEWYASYYWHYKTMIIYPNDKYAIPDGLTGVGSTNRGAITKDFAVRSYFYTFYSIGGQWYTTRDGHDWVHCKEQFRPDRGDAGNWTRKENKGIFVKDNWFYLGEIDDTGQVHFTKYRACGEISILGSGNGYYFYTKNRETHPTIYRMDWNGSESITTLHTSEYTVSGFGAVNEFNVISGHFLKEEIKNISYIAVSSDGFSSFAMYSSLEQTLPNYGDNLAFHYWYDKSRDKSNIYWTVRRRDPNHGAGPEYLCDVGIPGDPRPFFTTIWSGDNITIDIAGAGTPNLRNSYYRDHTVQDGGKLSWRFVVPDSPSPNYTMYFDDGKPSYPFGWVLQNWSPWNDCVFTGIIGYCDRHGKSSGKSLVPPNWNLDGSFGFALSHNYMIDPDNETWDYPYG